MSGRPTLFTGGCPAPPPEPRGLAGGVAVGYPALQTSTPPAYSFLLGRQQSPYTHPHFMDMGVTTSQERGPEDDGSNGNFGKFF